MAKIYFSFIPFSIQLIVLLTLLTESKYLKISIKIWTGIIIISGVFEFLSVILRIISLDFKEINWMQFIQSLILFIIAVSFFKASNKYIVERNREQEG
jgi:hypothetical protein